MSQENSTPEQIRKSKENRNKILLGTLIVVLLGVVYVQFFSGSGETNPLPRTPGAVSANARTTPSSTPQRQTSGTPAPIISQPLGLASIDGGSRPSNGTGRNIFVYPTPTPEPPPPPPTPAPSPTPWPIPVFSINPGNVIARTPNFTLTVFGENMPRDAQGLINGRAYQTTVVNDKQIKVNVLADAIKAPGMLTVSVRSLGNLALYSNPVSLNVAAAPEPPYKYIGLVTIKGSPTATMVSKSNDDDLQRVGKGQLLAGRWKIINITPQKVEIEDISIKVSHIINFTTDTR